MFLLDTAVLSELRKKDRNPGLVRWIRDKRNVQLFISVVTIGEIARGIQLQKHKDAAFAAKLNDWLSQLLLFHKDQILSVTTPVAIRWGRLSAVVGHAGADVLIAATALEHGLTVVTRNERHFVPTGVPCINPWE
jgi:predicted nucleic acid-binding protein